MIEVAVTEDDLRRIKSPLTNCGFLPTIAVQPWQRGKLPEDRFLARLVGYKYRTTEVGRVMRYVHPSTAFYDEAIKVENQEVVCLWFR